MDQGKIGAFIAQMRKEKKYTQRQLADLLGISDKTISKWECGNGLPEVSLMLPLCEALGITVNELLSGERLGEKAYREKAEENIVRLMREKYGLASLAAILSVLSTVFILFLSCFLSLRITSAQATWVGSADMKIDTGGFMANMVLFLVPAILFGAVQGFLSFKTRGRQIQMIPLALTIGGLLFCLAVYLGMFGSGSPSVVAENRYFAMFLCIPVSGAFAGCLAGIAAGSLIRK